MTDDDKDFPRGWEAHQADQVRFLASSTTPQQRFDWLRRTLALFGKDLPKVKELEALRIRMKSGKSE